MHASGNRLHRVLFGGLAVLLAGGPAAEAHEKWFLDAEAYPLQSEALADPWTWLAVGGPVAMWVVALLLWRRTGRRSLIPGPERLGGTPEGKDALFALMPLFLALHLGVPLLVNGLNHTLFTPNNSPGGIWAHLFTLGQIGVMLGLVYGSATRLFALVLALMWGAGLIVVGVEPMLEAIHILGFSAFFFCAGRGPLAVDRALFPKWEPSARLVVRAVPLLRVGVGLSLIVVAFTEKILNLPMAVDFLAEYPMNFLPALGVPLTDAQFALLIGAVELLVGLCVLSGVFLRDVIVIAWIPFNLTLGIFGPDELVGHLPFYGAMALFFVWGKSDPQNLAAWERGILRPSLAALFQR
ncbi:MAG: DoxX protein [candidate division NC10 bacterium]|nr:DoxX protein [candidate division NC10 bacterium]